MRQLYMLASLLLATVALAQTPPSSAPTPTHTRWGSLGASATLLGTGLAVGYGEQDLLAPGTDARFSVRYFSDLYPSYYETLPSFALEFRADALTYTYDPDPTQSLALVAYGGLGPRVIIRTGLYDYNSPWNYEDPNATPPLVNAYLVNIGGLGGLEARLGRFGLFLEVDLSLPVLGFVGPRFRALPLDVGTAAELTIGTNYYF